MVNLRFVAGGLLLSIGGNLAVGGDTRFGFSSPGSARLCFLAGMTVIFLLTSICFYLRFYQTVGIFRLLRQVV